MLSAGVYLQHTGTDAGTAVLAVEAVHAGTC